MNLSLSTRSQLPDEVDAGRRGEAHHEGLSSTGVPGSRVPPLRPAGACGSRPSVFTELPPRGLQALCSVMLAPRAPLPIEPRLNHKGLAATVPMCSRAEVSPEEMPLAGYLLARALDGRKVEGKDFERLRRADESIRETRALLAFGRANVKEDNKQSRGEAFRRFEGANNLKPGSTHRSLAAHWIWAGAGNCGEHAHVATFAHAGRLDSESKEEVALLANVFIDHAWVESAIPRPWNLASWWRPDEEAIVIDAWKDGPAVFAPDSTRTQGQWMSAITARRIASPQPELIAEAKIVAQDIACEQDPRALSWRPRPTEWWLSNARTVINNAFMERVLPKPVSVEQVLDTVRKSSPAASTETFHPATPAEVRKEILAVGVARDLMAAPESMEHTPQGRGRVWSAAGQAPTLIDAVGSLTKNTPRRYQPWMIPSVPYRAVRFDQPDELRLVRRRTEARTTVHDQLRETSGLTSDLTST